LSENKVSVAVTGVEWMGAGIGSIRTALEALISQAHEEVLITAYRVTTAADVLIEALDGALTRGVAVHLVVNRLAEQDPGAADRLHGLAARYKHMNLYDFSDPDFDLHAKTVVVDRRVALVGSSNMSRRGIMENHELGVVVEGPAAGQVAGAIDRLVRSHRVRAIGPSSRS
jgi:cardiolipin synthase